ncbi:DUF3196 family protein [Spiroplasma endosymbiont of Acasis viretata]|uniref:DUF3196 family protein n=1 Tax=Spiroplasma endosymbiont of Acasis viretata TaxID=3066306 RepID=UPI00313A89EF
MINHDNYYQDIIGKINHLISENKWDQAMKLVKHELEMPYIPIHHEVTLQELHHNITTHIRLNSKNESHEWNLERISHVLMNPFDEDLHPVAFYYLQSHNARLILPTIKIYLTNKNINNINKTQLLFILNNQGIDEEIEVIKGHDTFKINPKKITQWQESLVYLKITKIFEDEVHIDNPGIYGICLFLLDSYFENLFPTLPNKNQAAALAAALYIRACSFQFISVKLVESAKKFKTTTTLIKKYLSIMIQQQIT